MSQRMALTERALRAEGGPVRTDFGNDIVSFYGVSLSLAIFTSPLVYRFGAFSRRVIRYTPHPVSSLSQEFNVIARRLLTPLALSHHSSKTRGCDA